MLNKLLAATPIAACAVSPADAAQVKRLGRQSEQD